MENVSASKYKAFSKILLVGVGNGLTAGFGLFFLWVTAKFLDLDSFGKYSLSIGFLVFMSKLIDFGTNSIFVSESIHQSQNESRLVSEFFASKVMLFGISVPISLIFLRVFGLWETSMIIGFIVGLAGYAILYSIQPLFQKDEAYGRLVFVNSVPAVVKGLAAVLILLGVIKINYVSAFWIFALSALFVSPVSFLLPDKYKNVKLSWIGLSEVISKSYHAGLSQLIYEGWGSVQNIITKLFGTFSHVGVYSLANKISAVFTVISVSIFTVLLTKNSKRKAATGVYDFTETGILVGGVLFFALVTAVLAELLFDRLFGPQFKSALRILDILILANAFTTIQNFSENYFFANQKPQLIFLPNLAKLISLLGLSVILVSRFGLVGLAISSLAASVVGLTYSSVLIWQNYHRSQSA